MKKLVPFVILCISGCVAFPSLCFSQMDMSGRFSVTVSAGAAIPVGQYASKDTAGSLATSGPVEGWAKIGEAVALSADYHFNNRAGITIELGGQRNKRDAVPLEEEVLAPGPIPHPNAWAVVHEGSWRAYRVMIGGLFDIPLSAAEKWALQARILAGFFKTAIPGESYSMFDPTTLSDTTFVLGGSSGSRPLPMGICYKGSLGVKYLWTQRLSLVAEAGYSGARTEDRYSYYENPLQPSSNLVHVVKTYHLNTITPMIRVQYDF